MRPTVVLETVSVICSSTSASRRSRTVHRGRPSGGAEQAMRVSSASKRPSNLMPRGGVSRSLRSSAASRPSSTNRCLRCSRVRSEKPVAVATSSTFHRSLPNSPTSSSRSALAKRTFRDGWTPLLEMAVSSSRSSCVSVTMYVACLPMVLLLSMGYQPKA